jgi:hypothetical protein
MLRSLYIQNYALIEKLDISFSSGFSVITGETGAGKSIILGAIGLLLGQRADVKAIRVGASKCIIEARFDISAYGMQPFFEENELEYEEECILRREVSASGKSRAFINDTPASLAQMKELGEQLIDVHSQHQNLLLNKEGFQLNVLDILSHNEEALSAYQHIFGAWKQAQQDLEALVARANQDKSDEDYIRFQLEQLEEAHLSAGEQEELEQEADTLSHAEEIKAGLYRVGQMLYSDEGGLLSGLKECLNTMLNQSANNIACFIGGNAARNAQYYFLPFQYICHLFLSHFTQTYLGQRGFGIQGKITVQNPAVIAGIALQDIGYRHALVLAEVEYFHTFVIVDHTTGKVHILVEAGIVGKESHVILQLRIAVQLRHQHFVGGTCISLCRMGVFQILAAIEFIGSR